jgi:adenylate cyclase
MKSQMRWSALVLGVFLVAGLIVIRILDPVPLQGLRNAYFDYMQRLSPRIYQDLPVKVVDIDERSLAAYGQWPWPRDHMARLVDNLTEAGAAVIAFDFIFAEADRYSPALLLESADIRALLRDDISDEELQFLDNDGEFAQAMSRATVVLGVASASAGGMEAGQIPVPGLAEIGNMPRSGLHSFTRSTTIVEALANQASGFGNINTTPGLSDGKIRQVPLVWRTQNGVIPTLGLESLRVAFGESTIVLRGLGNLEGAMESVQIGSLVIPTTPKGEVWVHYRHDDPRLYVSAADVLDPQDPVQLKNAVGGKIILVGTSAAGLLDIRTTVLGETVPGVSIHAQMIEQILLDSHLIRTDFVVGLEIIAQAVVGLLTAIAMALAGPLISFLAGAVAAVAVITASWWIFLNYSVLADATYPLLGGAISFGTLTAFRFLVTDREKRMIRNSFSQYLAPSVLADIENQGFQIELGGQTRELTVMFSDIRNFTPLTESMPADTLVSLLNDLFTDLSQEVLDNGGTIDKFIGDSIMAFWNAPLTLEDHSRQAALAALGMRDALETYLAKRPDTKRKIEIGIGLHAGEACVGNIGSRQRFNYSAVGRAVNVAARIESSCKLVNFDIVASGVVQAAAPDLAWLPLGTVILKGVSEQQSLFALVGGVKMAQSCEFKTLAELHAALIGKITSKHEFAADLVACRMTAEALMDRLAQIYDGLPERVADMQITYQALPPQIP